jgi:cytoskeletal protein CcmA (bactofilin family)
MMSDPVSAKSEGSPLPDPFDTEFYFDRWLQAITGEREPVSRDVAEAIQQADSESYIGSFLGSNCEVTFEGVLHFDGYTIGDISSPAGTLVLTRRGRIEADINVRVAVINGSVIGNIMATDRVVLEREAKVTGFIYTPALTVRLGAIFDGECRQLNGSRQFQLELNGDDLTLAKDLEGLAVAASV